MDVRLYVYDLSRGLARQFSAAFVGTQLDAIYHTSLVFGGVEYFFGAGIQRASPGTTHHGQPMEVVLMGQTGLDDETIQEYLNSLSSQYTAESYDLFFLNCNNFTNDLSQFLVGKSIPEHITGLPQTFLETPLGQMLRPQLDQMVRGITQAPIPTSNDSEHGGAPVKDRGSVYEVTTVSQLDSLLCNVGSSCATIFFTSRSCAPCRTCYPIYESLAEEFKDKIALIKVDIQVAPEIKARYHIRATPTFMNFLHGKKLEEWTGADPAALEQKIRLLTQMAHPPHPHHSLSLPSLQKRHEKPILYAKVPPLEKLLAELGEVASDPMIAEMTEFVSKRFLAKRDQGAPPILNMKGISASIRYWIPKISSGKLFALIDLLRIALVDPRLSGYLAEEAVPGSVMLTLLEHITGDEEFPYSCHITAVQAVCNLFSSELYPPKLLGNESLAEPLTSLIAICLLDNKHTPLRVSAASLAFNITSWNHRRRIEGLSDVLKEGSQIELAASLVEAISREHTPEALRGLLLALGLLAFGAPANGELKAVLLALDAASIISTKTAEIESSLVDEVKQVLA